MFSWLKKSWKKIALTVGSVAATLILRNNGVDEKTILAVSGTLGALTLSQGAADATKVATLLTSNLPTPPVWLKAVAGVLGGALLTLGPAIHLDPALCHGWAVAMFTYAGAQGMAEWGVSAAKMKEPKP